MFRAPGRVNWRLPLPWWSFQTVTSAAKLAFLGASLVVCMRPARAQASPPQTAVEKADNAEPLQSAEPFQVVWTSTPGCREALRLETEVRQLLGSAADSADVTVEASLLQLSGGRFRLDLELTGRVSGTRSLEAERCDEAVRAGAVVLALAINPEALDGVASPPPVQAPVEPAPAEEPAPPPSPEEEAPEVRQTLPLRVVPFAGVHGRVSQSLTPGPRGGAGLALGAQIEWLRLEARGFVDPHKRETGGPEGPAVFWAAGGGMRVCGRAIDSPMADLHFCGGTGVVRVQGRSDSFGEAAQRATILTGDIGVLFRWHLVPRLSLVLDGGYVVPATRPRFIVDGGDRPVHVEHQISAGPVGTLGIEIALGSVP